MQEAHTQCLGDGGKSAEPSVRTSLDLTDPKDRAMLRKAIADWPGRFRAITQEMRDHWVHVIDDTIKRLAEAGDVAVCEAIRTGIAMETLNAKDAHKFLEATMRMIESGAQASRPTVSATFRMVFDKDG